MRACRFIVPALILACGFARAAEPTAEPSFSHDVYPVLRERCWSCHSGNKPEGKLRFDDEAAFRRGGESGPVFVAGKPDQSYLIEQITGKKPAMPPEGSALTAEQVDVLRRWIAGGAKIDRMPVDTSAVVAIPKVYDFAPSVTSVAFSPDDKLIACACRSEAVIVSTKEESKPPLRLPTESDLLTHVEFSPDGKLLAVIGGSPARFGEVRFFDPATGKLIASRRESADTLFRGAFSPDGKAIALGGADGAVYIVPVDVKQPAKRIELHSDWVVDVAYTPDGTRLVSVGRDKTTKVASVEKGELLRTIDTGTERMNAVVSDDKLAASCGLTGTLNGYELDVALQNVEVAGSGNGARPVSRVAQYLRSFGPQSGEVLDMALSGDHQLLAVVGRFAGVRLYTFADRKAKPITIRPTNLTYAVALNADGTQVVVGGKSGQLELFDVATGKLLRSIEPVPVKTSLAKK